MKMSHDGWEPTFGAAAWQINAPADSPGVVTLTLRTGRARRAGAAVEAFNLQAARELRDDLTAAINAAAAAELFSRPPYIHTPAGSGDTRPLTRPASSTISRP